MLKKHFAVIMAALLLLMARGSALADDPMGAELTRGAFAKMLCEAFDFKASADAKSFADVSADSQYAGYISALAAAKIMNGCGDGTLRPDEPVLFEQAIYLVLRMTESRDWYEYPRDYLLRAAEIGISDGVTATSGDALTLSQAERLIENAKTVKSDDEAITTDMVYTMTTGSSSGGGGGALMPSANRLAIPQIAEEYSYGYSSGGYFNTEEYTSTEENIFKSVSLSPISTFSIDTDTASYSNMRRYVLSGNLPPNGSIRTEELINYFDYDLPAPEGDMPFSVTSETSVCPWNENNLLTMISIKGEELSEPEKSNLVFLLDVSGSMFSPNKLPLVKKSMKMLLSELCADDTVSIVTYASGTGVALESTPVSEKEKIESAIDSLMAGGATNGSAGLSLAYEQAEKRLINGNNRIILCTDGDFNVGPSSTGELEKLIKSERDKGIFLTVLGFGMGNYKDNRLETLADKGNGAYAYIDSAREAKRIFVDELPKTLYTIAKDVKIQVKFDPEYVSEYRLVGYENRNLEAEDFANDKKDAGELQSGSCVVALYEILPAKAGGSAPMSVNVRYKEPAGNESRLITFPIEGKAGEGSVDFKFAAAVAELGMALNESEYKGTSSFDSVIALAKHGIGEDELGFRTEFLHLVDIMRYTD